MTEITEKTQQQATLSPRDIEAQDEKTRQKSLNATKNNNGRIDNKRLKGSYKKTLGIIRKQLTPPLRTVSIFIHLPIIEWLSELIGRTIARPNAILVGGVFAFTFTLFAYILSMLMDYKISGSETILSFFVGWLIGTIYDYTKILFTGKNQ